MTGSRPVPAFSNIRSDGSISVIVRRVRAVHATVAGSGDNDPRGVALDEASATVAGSRDIRTGEIDYRSALSVSGNLGR
ncbi:MAG: hypothetical protein WBA68_01435 [Alteraurantiacibacter sp.]